MYQKLARLWDKTWKDKHGNVVIFQWPNGWLCAWAAVTFISLLMSGIAADVMGWVALGLLAIWSVIEIASGVNYFRRAFGFVILLFTIASIIRGIT